MTDYEYAKIVTTATNLYLTEKYGKDTMKCVELKLYNDSSGIFMVTEFENGQDKVLFITSVDQILGEK